MIINCELDTGADVPVIPLSTYQHVNTSEFDTQGQCIGDYGQDKTILKEENDNHIKQYDIRVIFSK